MKSDQPDRYEHIIARAGPFHLYMDDFKSNNRMFEEILNWLLGGMYSGNLNVLGIRFLSFKDPTTSEKTLSGLLLAIQACLI